MNANEFNISELRAEDLRQTNGGFFFLLTLLPAVVASLGEAAVAWAPIVGAAVKGWGDKH